MGDGRLLYSGVWHAKAMTDCVTLEMESHYGHRAWACGKAMDDDCVTREIRSHCGHRARWLPDKASTDFLT